MVWYSHFFKSFPQFVMIHTVKGYDPADVGNLISSSSSFSKPNLDIWKFLVHTRLKPSIQDFKHDLTSIGDEFNCLMVITFFSTEEHGFVYLLISENIHLDTHS